MIKIYHNPRCRKSREGLQILEASGETFEIIKYLEDVPTEKELRQVLNCLDIKPEQLIRKNESIWKENFKGKLLSDDEIIDIMLEHPKLIERPIVIKDNKAIIGRPPENIKSIL
ncbi:arsenate reductase [Zhouia amylolytica]|uniref:Glutaredoxin-dependent arsenate reductase n=2 Tax=Zhouia amylolytica TaxID=376730 RepID=W2UPG7_9FLAO|nr:arsenate reductase (glutaredoxin) [Zhouia amylolytica]ETN95371.1 glutaredoxin-dependent arsenate reductase [Zhouia amylolytica AD3]MCQ0112814.1 arsenate reductase (glutaredoxin) [Zhouia amylolytica]SFT00719.1 arsenate reductase [Zhouia amylolytica]